MCKVTDYDLSKPPCNCPYCNGQREWGGLFSFADRSGMAICENCGQGTSEKLNLSEEEFDVSLTMRVKANNEQDAIDKTQALMTTSMCRNLQQFCNDLRDRLKAVKTK